MANLQNFHGRATDFGIMTPPNNATRNSAMNFGSHMQRVFSPQLPNDKREQKQIKSYVRKLKRIKK